MTATSSTVRSDLTGDASALPSLPAVFGDVMKSEWTKIRTVRSTFWTLVTAAVCMVGFACLAAAVIVSQYGRLPQAEQATVNSVEIGVAGAFFAQLAIGVLGVLVITTEYGTGMIRATFGAVPQRRLVLSAKALVFFLVSLVIGVLSSFIGFFASQQILSGYAKRHLNASITDPGALRAVIGAGVFLAVMGLLGFAIGAVLRRSAGAIAALFGLIFFLPGLMQLLPASIGDHVNKYLPSNAGASIYRQVQHTDLLSPGAGLLVMCAYAIGALVIAGLIVERRDA